MSKPTQSGSVLQSAALLGSLVITMVWAGPAALGAEDAHSIVVAQDASGDVGTIAEALAQANDGDTIVVKPGTYEEAIFIDKDITLTGDGQVDDVIISFSDAETPLVAINDAEAVLSSLTLTGADSLVHVAGGAPTLQGLRFDGVGITFDEEVACHALFGPTGCNPVGLSLEGTDARVLGSTFEGSGEIRVHGGGAPVIEDNQSSGRSHILLEEFDDETVVRGNTITSTEKGGVVVYSVGHPLIEDNVISDSGGVAITVGIQVAPGNAPIVRGNLIAGNETGIQVAAGTEPTIEGNELTDNKSAIVIAHGDARIISNRIHDNSSGVFVAAGTPTLEGNEITGGKVGLGLGSDQAAPILIGNTICENETNVSLIFGAEMPDSAGNDVCADDA